MRLPNSDRAIIEKRKLADYLLSTSHPIGRFKAAFFNRRGYFASNYEEPEKAFRTIIANSEVAESIESQYGRKYVISGDLIGLRGSATVTTVWIIVANEDEPRFVTACPGESGDVQRT